MELLQPIKFVAERLAGGAYAALAELVMDQTVEPVEPQMAAIHYFPDRTPPEDLVA